MDLERGSDKNYGPIDAKTTRSQSIEITAVFTLSITIVPWFIFFVPGDCFELTEIVFYAITKYHNTILLYANNGISSIYLLS